MGDRLGSPQGAVSFLHAWSRIRRVAKTQTLLRDAGASACVQKKACEVAAALKCTLSQNGYGDDHLWQTDLAIASNPWFETFCADGHTRLNAPDLF